MSADQVITQTAVRKSIVRIAAIVPAYQAENGIQKVLEQFCSAVDLIIVVDDGSTDQTSRLVKEFPSQKIVLLRHEENRGVGAAMKTGISRVLETDCHIAVKVDADGQMRVEDLSELLKPLLENQADISKGNRWGDQKALLQMPVIRRFGNLGLSFLTRVASGQWEVFDPNNGYVAWRTDWLRQIDLQRIPNGFTFEAGMLVQSGITGALVRDVSLPAVYGVGSSHLNVHKAFFQFSFYLFLTAFHRIWRQYFLTDFNAVSLLLLAGTILTGFGSLFGGYHWWQSTKVGIPATSGTVIIAALPVLLGFNCLLQAMMIDVTNRPDKKLCRDLPEYPEG